MLRPILIYIIITIVLITINIITFILDRKENNKRILLEDHSTYKWTILISSIISEILIGLFMFSYILLN